VIEKQDRIYGPYPYPTQRISAEISRGRVVEGVQPQLEDQFQLKSGKIFFNNQRVNKVLKNSSDMERYFSTIKEWNKVLKNSSFELYKINHLNM